MKINFNKINQKYLINSFLFFCFCIFLFPLNVQAQCDSNDYIVVYVNGIFTATEAEAKKDMGFLQDYFKFYLGERADVIFRTGYNESHIGGLGDLVQVASQILKNPISDYDLKTILIQLHSQINTKKILLVGHSQGTFYTNEMYKYLVNNGIPKKSIAVYNIATPANFVAGNGEYLTSRSDKVINAVRRVASSINASQPLPANNIDISPNEKDPNGHLLSEVYLETAAYEIVSKINNALKKLDDTNSATSNNAGCFVLPKQDVLYNTQKIIYPVITDPIGNVVVKTGAVTYKVLVFTGEVTAEIIIVTGEILVDSVIGLSNAMINSVILAEKTSLATMDFITDVAIKTVDITVKTTNKVAKNINKKIKNTIAELTNFFDKKIETMVGNILIEPQIVVAQSKKNEPQILMPIQPKIPASTISALPSRQTPMVIGVELRENSVGTTLVYTQKTQNQYMKIKAQENPAKAGSVVLAKEKIISKNQFESEPQINLLDLFEPILTLTKETKEVQLPKIDLNSTPTAYYSAPVSSLAIPTPDPALPLILLSEICPLLENLKTTYIELYNPNDFKVELNNDNFQLKFIDSNGEIIEKVITWIKNIIPPKGYFLLSSTPTIGNLLADAIFMEQINFNGVIISDKQNVIKDKMENIILQNNQSLERKIDEADFSITNILTPTNSLNEKNSYDFQAPETILEKFPDAKTTANTANFVFSSNESDVIFQYSLDNSELENGVAQKEFQNLKLGEHILKAWAIDASGNIDLSPIIFQWQIQSLGPTFLNGEMTEDMTLTAENNPYIIENSFVVPENKTLTIGSGVIIQIESLGTGLTVNGDLKINGTTESPVKFTSTKPDPSFGDYVRALLINETSKNSVIENAIFEYGDQMMIIIIPMVSIENTDVKISNTIFRKAQDIALRLKNSNSVIENCIFENNLFIGLSIDSGQPEIKNSLFKNNGIGIEIFNQSKAKIQNNIFENNKMSFSKYLSDETIFQDNQGLEDVSQNNNPFIEGL